MDLRDHQKREACMTHRRKQSKITEARHHVHHPRQPQPPGVDIWFWWVLRCREGGAVALFFRAVLYFSQPSCE